MSVAALATRSALNRDVNAWVDAVAQMAQPSIIHWCTGTSEESRGLEELLTREGSLLPLHAEDHPHSFLARTSPTPVEAARTLLCSRNEAEAGPSNCWADPVYMQDVIDPLFTGCMKQRVMYVVPYLLGPPGSPLCEAGIQITDSALAAYLTSKLVRVGMSALRHIGSGATYFRGVHSLGSPDASERLVCLYPDENLALSHGSSHWSDMALAHRWHALRMSSVRARKEGWLAEQMAVLCVTSPDGAKSYLGVMGASGTGKTTLATLMPPDIESLAGWRVELVSDGVSWLHWQRDGQLHAVNPEIGLCSQMRDVNSKLTPSLSNAVQSQAVFMNVGLTLDRHVWWQGREGEPPSVCTDWRGREWASSSGKAVSHPEARCLLPMNRVPTIAKEWNSSVGVPLSAILFCSRRSSTIPLACEAFDWEHGVYMGATLMSEPIDSDPHKPQPFFDPMGMRSQCGYHLADYWQHWLDQARRPNVEPPRIYHVNWFQRDWSGKLLWPGYRDNFAVLKWIVDRTRGRGDATRSPIGILPTQSSLGMNALKWPRETVRALLEVTSEDWYKELDQREEFLVRFSTRLPPELLEQNESLRKRMWYGRQQKSSR